ncbi:hypothetical protein EMCRGX_G029849 [Ephydatia muelleri]
MHALGILPLIQRSPVDVNQVWAPPNDLERNLLSLPPRLGGLGIPNPNTTSDTNTASRPSHLILLHDSSYPTEAIEQQVKAKKEVHSFKLKHSQGSASNLRPQLANSTQHSMDLAQEKGASNWLTTLTIDENGFTLHKGAFRDAIALRCWSSGLRIQHLLDAVEVPLQTPILHSLKAVVNILSSGRAPALISPFLAGGNLTALVKSKDSCALDICPIAVGKTLRRLTAKCLCAVVKAKAAEFFQPHQFGVSCSMGAEKIAHELYPWVLWCYGQHPILWHPMGTLTSECGVQQGDPLGPLLFCLVLNILVKDICSDPNCANLSFHSWYLDDGVVAGPSLAVQKVLALIEEKGPLLGLLVNFSKCEVFSPTDFCSNYISNKCGDAKLLLRKLEEVGAQDAQVALVLLRLCGSFCKLAHRARATPPSLSIKALELFDIDVRHCFSQYTAVDTSDEAWLQAQLSLSRGGLGLRSLSSHAAAAYIASLCSSDFGSLSSLHLTSAIGKFNSALSAKIDDTQFNQLFNSSSLADRARLLSISSPHASSWLSVVPSEGLGLHLNPDQFQVAIKWWLGLDTSGGSLCSLCPDTVLDPLGHHASTCKRGGDAVFRHNRLRDVVGESCRLAHLSVKVEAGNNLTPDHSHTRPADVLV